MPTAPPYTGWEGWGATSCLCAEARFPALAGCLSFHTHDVHHSTHRWQTSARGIQRRSPHRFQVGSSAAQLLCYAPLAAGSAAVGDESEMRGAQPRCGCSPQAQPFQAPHANSATYWIRVTIQGGMASGGSGVDEWVLVRPSQSPQLQFNTATTHFHATPLHLKRLAFFGSRTFGRHCLSLSHGTCRGTGLIILALLGGFTSGHSWSENFFSPIESP